MSELNVGVRELKSRLSEYLRKAKTGQIVTVTEHGQPIVYMISATQSLAEKTQAMIDAGLMSWNGKKLKASKPAARNRSKRLASDLLIEDRE
jgi:prevent-host-death family protein